MTERRPAGYPKLGKVKERSGMDCAVAGEESLIWFKGEPAVV